MGMENGSNDSCFEFDRKEVEGAIAAKSTVASLSFIACAAVIVFILIFGGYKTFVYRLVLYFMTADMLQSFAQVFEVAAVKYDAQSKLVGVRDGWATACTVFGFLDQLSMWMSNCVIIWIMLYLLSLAILLQFVQSGKSRMNTNICKTKSVEVMGIVLVICVPFTFNWIPFIWNMYGFSGLFCWIKNVSNNNCNDRRLSVILMFTMSYGPLLSLIFIGFLCLLVVTIILYRSSRQLRKNLGDTVVEVRAKELVNKSTKEIAFILVFPILYDLLCLVIVTNRIYAALHSDSKPFYPLWIAHVIASPGRLLVSPVAFFFHPYTWKTLFCKRQEAEEQDADTYFIVQPEEDDIEEPIIIRGQGIGAGNTATTNRNYKSIRN